MVKTRIRIAIPTFVFFAVLLLSDPSLFSFTPFLASLLHELGHIFAMAFCGERITEINILPFGVDIKRAPSVISYKNDIIVNAAGIATNLALIIMSEMLPECKESIFFIQCNTVLICINILPIKSLDGGQTLERILLLRFSPDTVDRVLRITSFIGILLLWSVAIWLLFYTTYNFSLLLMCMYLFFGSFLKR